jgi:hypothetical protein
MLSVIMLSVIMLSVVMLSVVMLSVVMLYRYAECRYAECRYAECRGAGYIDVQQRKVLLLSSKKYIKELHSLLQNFFSMLLTLGKNKLDCFGHTKYVQARPM